MDDFLWEHFLPVWRDFGTSSAGSILIAGGYGLFLKQQWLKQLGNIPTVIPFQNWIDTEPRVTKDVDLILGLDLIKDSSQQKTFLSSLSKNGFEPSDRPHEQRWKFIKRIQGDRSIVVEMHASKPERGMTGIIATDKRVKHKPSLGSHGVHGRTNPEAAGSELVPFTFAMDGVELKVPNPVTWSVMKLAATSDRWSLSQSPDLDEQGRDYSRFQAAKHAQDVFRTIALMTLQERDHAGEVVASISEHEAFRRAREIWNNDFSISPIPVVRELASKWRQDDALTIRQILSGWFG